MKVIERNWNWWAYFWRVIHLQTIKGIDKWNRNVVRFIINILGCEKGKRILDLGAGSGEHTRLFAKKGIKCVGVEIVRYETKTNGVYYWIKYENELRDIIKSLTKFVNRSLKGIYNET